MIRNTEAVAALTALFVERAFTAGTYRNDEFAEACAAFVAETIGATPWRVNVVRGEVVLVVLDTAVLIDDLFGRVRGGTVGAMEGTVRRFVEGALRERGMERGWSKVTP